MRDFSKKFIEKINNLYRKEKLLEVARETGFIKRAKKISPQMFFDMLLFKEQDNAQVSLNDHSVDLQLKYNLDVKRQSIDERFTSHAVDFIKALISEQLNSQITKSIDIEVLKPFTSVNIKDSTRFQIPASLQEYYPGNGGAASDAGVHIQFEFDLLSGKVKDLNPTDAKRQDKTDAKETVGTVEKNSLVIRDLGYFDIGVLHHINEQGAYYISRLLPKVNVYEKKEDKFVEIDFKLLKSKLNKAHLTIAELEVYIGEQKKEPVRLLVELMPEELVAKRMKKVNKEAKKKGRKVSDKYRYYAMFNLFITNAPQNMLKTSLIHTLYQLRWQIELRFKIWKSFFSLHKTKKMKRYRLECYLYACLLHIIINWEIAVNFFQIIWKTTGKVLSIIKLLKTMKYQTHFLRQAILVKPGILQEYLYGLFEISKKNLVLERKKKVTGLTEILTIKLDN